VDEHVSSSNNVLYDADNSDVLPLQMEKNRLKEEQEKRLQDERTKFIEKTKNLLIFEPVEDDKPKRSAGPSKVCRSPIHSAAALLQAMLSSSTVVDPGLS